MFSRKLTSITLLAATLTAGAASLAPAEAAQAGGSRGRAEPSWLEAPPIHAVLEHILGLAPTLWATLGEQTPQSPRVQSKNREEGPGVCPNGQPWWKPCPPKDDSGGR